MFNVALSYKLAVTLYMTLESINKFTYRQISSKLIFVVTIIITALTCFFLINFELGRHQTLFKITFSTAWTLATIFYVFVFYGLYYGIKLKEDVGKILKKPKLEPVESILGSTGVSPSSTIEAIIYLIILIPAIVILILNFAVIIWTAILFFVAILYIIFYRGLKFIFKKSPICKNNLTNSFLYSSIFTLTYCAWFFIIIYIVDKYK